MELWPFQSDDVWKVAWGWLCWAWKWSHTDHFLKLWHNQPTFSRLFKWRRRDLPVKFVASVLCPISRATNALFFNPPRSHAHGSKVSNNKVTQTMKVEQRFQITLLNKGLHLYVPVQEVNVKAKSLQLLKAKSQNRHMLLTNTLTFWRSAVNAATLQVK